ncbi:MAG: hypothetical protein WC520_00170 [Candidatus Paceibacterota bacterium]
MAKPTKYATIICIVLTLLAIAGVIMAFLKNNPLILVGFLLPAVIYEAYRTEGKSTKWSSWALLAIFVLEIILIAFKINFDLASFLEKTQTTVAGYTVPLGDVKIVGPTIVAILSVVLFIKTRGVYTKWLAVIIFLGSFSLIYLLNPDVFQILLKFGVEQGLQQIK